MNSEPISNETDTCNWAEVASGEHLVKESEPWDSSVLRSKPHHVNELSVTNRTLVFRLQSNGNVLLPIGTVHDWVTTT